MRLMAQPNRRKGRRLQPTIVGSGLVALDIVIKSFDDDVQHFAGGTCGNVLSILSYLGWNARPVSRLGNDLSASYLMEDLKKWGVDTSLVSTTGDGSTPVVIQRIRESADGSRSHSFSLRCPCCGEYLPGFKPILGKNAEELFHVMGVHQVFFFDRVSRGILNLAKASAAIGALVVFEPCGVGDPRLFEEAWSAAHVVKYSNDRLRDIADLDLQACVRNDLLLEVETLGAWGLRYRCRLKNASTKRWRTMKVIPADSVMDTAGSGDWCTAGIIQKLARGGHCGFSKVTEDRLTEALRYGQALATWNCAFEGSRAGMYHMSRQKFEGQIRSLLAGRRIRRPVKESGSTSEDLRHLCPACNAADFSKRRRSAAG